MTRRILLAVLLATSGFALVACGSAPEPPAEETQKGQVDLEQQQAIQKEAASGGY